MTNAPYKYTESNEGNYQGYLFRPYITFEVGTVEIKIYEYHVEISHVYLVPWVRLPADLSLLRNADIDWTYIRHVRDEWRGGLNEKYS